MSAEKTTRQVTFSFDGQECQGYEIHQGISDTEQRIVQQKNCIGTYVHGILDNPVFVNFLLRPFASRLSDSSQEGIDYQEFKEQQYDRLADHVRKYVDMEKLYKILSDD